MSYSVRWYASIHDVPRADWDRLRRGRPDPFMDPRFVAAVELGMAGAGTWWCLLVDDDQGRAVASACLSLYELDLAALGLRPLQRSTAAVRRLFPRFLKLPVVFCGLPVSAGQSHLCLAPEADAPAVLAEIDRALEELARRHRAPLIVLKEFSPDEERQLDGLISLGYVRGESPPMNEFPPRFRRFEDFVEALRSHYRYKLKRSQRKFARAGFRVEHLSGIDALPHYTDEVHRLYEEVVQRAEVRLECLPRSFFQQLVRHFPEAAQWTAVWRGDAIVAFAWGLACPDSYQNLFIGLDYRYNAEADLYFNLMAEDSGTCPAAGSLAHPRGTDR